MKLGVWGNYLTIEILLVFSRSSGVIQGQISKHCPIGLKLGRWAKDLMIKMLKVISRSSKVKSLNIYLLSWNLVCGIRIWWGKCWSSFQGHWRPSKVKYLNIVLSGWNLVCGLRIWWWKPWRSFQGQLRSTHYRMSYWVETWYMSLGYDDENVEGYFKVTGGYPSSNI